MYDTEDDNKSINLKSSLDRFIVSYLIYSYLTYTDLKSSLDRFIVVGDKEVKTDFLFKIQFG